MGAKGGHLPRKPRNSSLYIPRVTTVAEALAQYNANLSWQDSTASAKLALEAVRFLLANRAQQLSDQGTTINYESLAAEKAMLEKFFSHSFTFRANGRKRRVGAAFVDGGIG